MIQEMKNRGFYTIARVSAFRDYNYGLNHVPQGLPDAREAICRYHTEKGIKALHPDDVFFGNGVSELVPMVLQSLLQ